jgi:hypothetical protein
MPIVPKWMQLTLAVFAFIGAISAAAAALSYKIDRPAWLSELRIVAERTDRHLLKMFERERHEAIRERKMYEKNRQDPPVFLLDTISRLTRQIKEIEKRFSKDA